MHELFGRGEAMGNMYDRQVAQALTSPPTRYARGSMSNVLDRIEEQYETLREDLRRAMAMGVRPVQL